MTESSIVRLFWEVGNIILGADRRASACRAQENRIKPTRDKNRQIIPEKIRIFFEKHYAGWPEYVMLKAQIAILLLFLTTVVYLVLLPNENLIFLTLLSICSGYLIYQTKTQLRLAFKREYPAYRCFVVICITINWSLLLLLRLLPTVFSMESDLNIIMPTFLAFVIIISAFAAFRIKYGRNFTYGLVEESRGGFALVRVGYDIRSNVKSGVYPVESSIKVRKGDTVKLRVARPLLGLGGAKVKAITEVVGQSTSA
ncbi:MAG: DUF2101 family protein [Candidatus Hadarchaeum sp.]|uniref:DUF2101 family protein n=1 Tax=Candidatus Hadarchaeum sp. TaxID=2883567 RepID=UPI0031803D43